MKSLATALMFFWPLAIQASEILDESPNSSREGRLTTGEIEYNNNKLTPPELTPREHGETIEKIYHHSTLKIHDQAWRFRWHVAGKKDLNFSYSIRCINGRGLYEREGHESFAVYCLYPENEEALTSPNYIFYLYKPQITDGTPPALVPESLRTSLSEQKSYKGKLKQYLPHKQHSFSHSKRS